jgi:hypothetical protein
VNLIIDKIRINGDSFIKLLKQGQSEGSIRTDLSANELTAWTFHNLLALKKRVQH